MTISSEITKLINNLAACYTKCNNKGATMPANQNFDNLPDCINSIQTGGGSFIGIQREVSAAGIYQAPTTPFSFSLPSNATTLSSYTMYYAFYRCSGITSADLSSLTTITGNSALHHAFNNCSNLTRVDMSNLTTITNAAANSLNNAFSSSGLVSIDLSNLTTISGSGAFNNAFNNCQSLTSVDLSKLSSIAASNIFSYAFADCDNLTSLSFPSLNSSSFGTITNQFNGMFSFVSGSTVHFPSNLQSVIGSWSDVTSGFGGTNISVLFDLPATT